MINYHIVGRIKNYHTVGRILKLPH